MFVILNFHRSKGHSIKTNAAFAVNMYLNVIYERKTESLCVSRALGIQSEGRMLKEEAVEDQ